MSKVLKFIVHFVVICTLICVLGLVLPPFFGVKTVIVDKSGDATNLPVGSVTYAIPEKSSEVSVGTPILVQKDSKTYKYTITNLDASKGTGTVTDQSVSGGKTLTIKVGDYVPKVVITIGFVGYLLVATESIEGLIILGLVVLFLIILYVIAELWKKDPEDDIRDDEDDPEPGYVKSKKELKREEKERARRMKEEDREILQEEKARKRKKKKSEKRKVRTGGFVDEIDEDDIPEHNSGRRASAIQQTAQTAASEAHEELKKEIAAATSEENDVISRLERAESTVTERTERRTEKKQQEPQPEEEPSVAIGDLAMPSFTAAQLASRVKKSGDAPDIVKDDITNVTLFDYSDIISGTVNDTEE